MTQTEYIRTDLRALANWVTRYLKAPDGAAGNVPRAVTADTGVDMLVLEFEGEQVAIEPLTARILIRNLLRRDASTAGLCEAIMQAIDDIRAEHEGRTTH